MVARVPPTRAHRSDLQFWKQLPGREVTPSPSVTDVIFEPLKVVPPLKETATPFVPRKRSPVSAGQE